MATVSRALARIKQDLQPFADDQVILDACEQAGHRWRKRLLDPVVTVHLFMLQILNFNTGLSHLRHLAKFPVKPAAFCKARMRLPLDVLQSLLAKSAAAARQKHSPAGWNGLRAFLVDGSSTICPDTPALQKAFGQPVNQKPGCGFPIPKLLGLFDAFSGTIAKLLVAPLYTHVVTVVTTLLDPQQYPHELIAELYGVRWTVETHFDELKTALNMRQVKCRTPDGVKKELAVYCLVYNLVHALMVEAAGRQKVDPQRISFIDTVRWLLSASPGEHLPALLVNPKRPDRHEPRVIKDLKDTYRKMTKPRDILKQELHLWRGRLK